MKNRDDQLVLRGLLLIDDAYWGGKRRDGRMVFQWLNTVLGNEKNTLHGTCHVTWPSSAAASTTVSSWTRWWIACCRLLCTLWPLRSGCSGELRFGGNQI